MNNRAARPLDTPGTPPPPSSWTSLPVSPTYLAHYREVHSSSDTLKLFPNSPGSLEYSTVSNLVLPLLVESIEEVMNPELLNRFLHKRKELFRTKSDDLDLLRALGVNEDEVNRAHRMSTDWMTSPSLASVPYSDNFAILFHCTMSESSLASILEHGLDDRLGGERLGSASSSRSKGGRFGRGIYLTDDPLKAIAYDGGTGVILLVGVLLGDCLSIEKDLYGNVPVTGGFLREPEKRLEQKRNKGDAFFDSIHGRTGGCNEFVVYDRSQCVVLYQVAYKRGPIEPWASILISVQHRRCTPPFVWIPSLGVTGVAMPTGFNPRDWSYFARNVFDQMTLPSGPRSRSPGQSQMIMRDEAEIRCNHVPDEDMTLTQFQNLETLHSLGFRDRRQNKAFLARYGNDVDEVVNQLLDHGPDIPQPNQLNANASLGAVATTSTSRIHTSHNVTLAEPPPPQNVNPLTLTRSIVFNYFNLDVQASTATNELSDELARSTVPMDTGGPSTTTTSDPSSSRDPLVPIPPPTLEECPICCEELAPDPPGANIRWRVLPCSHKLCIPCYNRIEMVGVTMSGESHRYFKCPFCQWRSGQEIGSCPNGSMKVTEVPSPCEGYEGTSTLAIHYSVHNLGFYLSRRAYLPNTPDGRRVLDLLRVAWDRRLTFAIGTSGTSGRENVLVWNIHHKTATRGGVSCHGYPDPGYLERVQEELNAYGIE